MLASASNRLQTIPEIYPASARPTSSSDTITLSRARPVADPKPVEIVTTAGNLILPGTGEGFGREAGNGPSGYAPGYDTDGAPHPNRFEPWRVSVNIAVERPSGLVQEDTWIQIQSSPACSADA